MEAELPGIFNWAIRGARKLETLARFPVSQASVAYLANHRLACDHEAAYLNETVVAAPEGIIPKLSLYQMYHGWAESHGYKAFGMSRFNTAVKSAFPDIKEERQRKPTDQLIWHGIEFRHMAKEED